MAANSEPNSKGDTHFKDASKPDGDACRDDGTLKDADEMEWPNSPSEQQSFVLPEKRKREWYDYHDDEPYSDESPKAKVRYKFQTKFNGAY